MIVLNQSTLNFIFYQNQVHHLSCLVTKSILLLLSKLSKSFVKIGLDWIGLTGGYWCRHYSKDCVLFSSDLLLRKSVVIVHAAKHFKIISRYLPRFHHSFNQLKCKQIERRAFPLAKNWPSIELHLNALRRVLWVHRVLCEDSCFNKMFGTLPSSPKLFKFYADTQEIVDDPEVQMFYVEDKSGITGLLSSSTGDKEG